MSLGAWRAFDWQHQKLIADRAGISEKVFVVLNGMRLATDQAQQTTAKLTITRCRRRHFFELDLFQTAGYGTHASRQFCFFATNIGADADIGADFASCYGLGSAVVSPVGTFCAFIYLYANCSVAKK